jgi:hypothetical protein
MSSRVLKRLRNRTNPDYVSSSEFLSWGFVLLAGSVELNAEQAEAAWRAYGQRVREDWARYWQGQDSLPTCWAERVFDGVPQVETKGLDPWARDRIRGLEAAVKSWR